MGNTFTRFTLSARQRKIVSILVCILAVTGSRVEAVMAAVQNVPITLTTEGQTVSETEDDVSSGIRITPSYFGALTVADKIPAVAIRVVEMTAYNSEIGQTDASPFITANGTRVRDGIVAANFLKFNTRIRLPELYGDKIFVVTDRMNERYANRVDIWMEKKIDAKKFGVKRGVKIEIL